MDEVNFEEVLKEKRDKVWPVIKGYLDDLIDFPDFCKVSPKYAPMAEFHQKIGS